MVTASDGSPSRVTSRPLTAPAAAPATATTAKMASIGQPWLHRNPSRALDMPSVDATDRSISPLMTISVIGNVMIAISPLDRPRLKKLLPVRNCGDAAAPITTMITTTTARPDSHRRARENCARERWARSPRGVFSSGCTAFSSGCTAATPQSQGGGQPEVDGPVERDGQDEQETGDRLVPEGRDAEHVERRVDGVEQQRAECGSGHASAAAEYRHPADHDGGHYLQLVACPRGGVDRGVACGPQHARDPGDRAAQDERREHALRDRDASEACRLRIRPDRVEFPAGPEGTQVVRAGRDHDGDHDGEIGNPEDRGLRYADEAAGQRARDDLAAADDQYVDSPDDVEGGERHDEARHASDRHHEPVHDPAATADSQADEEHHGNGNAVVVPEEVRRDERGKPEDRPDGQVDVPADHDHRLAERKQREHGRVD